MTEELTTLRVSRKTWRRLAEMKHVKITKGDYANYSFDDMISELLDLKDSAIYNEQTEKAGP